MTRENDADWIAEGAKVAECRHNYSGVHVTLTTITKLTKTQVVVDTGGRYNRETLRRVGGGYGDTLKSADDEKVLNTIAAKTVGDLFFTLHQMSRASEVGSVAEALDALADIERAVATARRAVTANAQRVAEGE